MASKGHDGPAIGMACHPSGGLLATAGADRKVLVWDVDGGFCTHYFKGHKGVVSSILFHPDTDKSLVSRSVRIFHLHTLFCCSVHHEVIYNGSEFKSLFLFYLM